MTDTGGGSVDMSGYTAITGKITLVADFNPAVHEVLMQFRLAGVAAGNSVDIADYINTGLTSEQSFVIPKEDLDIAGATVDEMLITVTKNGTGRPDIAFDDMQIEQIGSPITFTATATKNSNFHVQKMKFIFADGVASTLTDGTMPALSYNKILGVNALNNGIVLRVVSEGITEISLNAKQLSDMIGLGGEIKEMISDGTNTMITVELEFSSPLILNYRNTDNNFVSLTINDSLSGLDKF
jgi:hypothetical protein